MLFCILYILFLELISEVHFVIKVATPCITHPLANGKRKKKQASGDSCSEFESRTVDQEPGITWFKGLDSEIE
jgi:hypothetical protein